MIKCIILELKHIVIDTDIFVYPSLMMINWVYDNGLASNNLRSKRLIDIIAPRKQRDLHIVYLHLHVSEFQNWLQNEDFIILVHHLDLFNMYFVMRNIELVISYIFINLWLMIDWYFYVIEIYCYFLTINITMFPELLLLLVIDSQITEQCKIMVHKFLLTCTLVMFLYSFEFM